MTSLHDRQIIIKKEYKLRYHNIVKDGIQQRNRTK